RARWSFAQIQPAQLVVQRRTVLDLDPRPSRRNRVRDAERDPLLVRVRRHGRRLRLAVCGDGRAPDLEVERVQLDLGRRRRDADVYPGPALESLVREID